MASAPMAMAYSMPLPTTSNEISPYETDTGVTANDDYQAPIIEDDFDTNNFEPVTPQMKTKTTKGKFKNRSRKEKQESNEEEYEFIKTSNY